MLPLEETAPKERVNRYVASSTRFVQMAEHLSATLLTDRSDTAWSATQIVHHLADMEIVSALRIRQAIACSGTSVGVVDQDAWAVAPSVHRRIETSLVAITASRAATAELLSSLDESQWNNHVVHEVAGPVTVRDLVEGATGHADEHRATLQMMWFQRLVGSE